MATNCVLMVRPHDFAFNNQTGADNEFQQQLALAVRRRACRS